jgi:hypothetical protein
MNVEPPPFAGLLPLIGQFALVTLDLCDLAFRVIVPVIPELHEMSV